MHAVLLDAIFDDLMTLRRRYGIPRVVVLAATGVVAVGLLIIPLQDSVKASEKLTPMQRIPSVDESFEWIREETPPDTTVLAVGFRNWDAWWVPEQTGRPVMDGWNDEGAPGWREIREVRHMGWFGQVNRNRGP